MVAAAYLNTVPTIIIVNLMSKQVRKELLLEYNELWRKRCILGNELHHRSDNYSNEQVDIMRHQHSVMRQYEELLSARRKLEDKT